MSRSSLDDLLGPEELCGRNERFERSFFPDPHVGSFDFAGEWTTFTRYPLWFVGLIFAAGALWKKGFSLVFATAGSSLRIEYKKHPLPESSAFDSGDHKQLTPKQ
jgi:hypothetical protein